MSRFRYWIALIRVRWAYRNGLPIAKIKLHREKKP